MKQFRDSSNHRDGCGLCGSLRHDLFRRPYKRRDPDGGGGSGQPWGNVRNTGCFTCGGQHRQRQSHRTHQDNSAEPYANPENNQASTQMSSQDVRLLSTIYPAFLVIPI